MQPPNILPISSIAHVFETIRTMVWIVCGAVVGLFLIYKFIYKRLGMMATTAVFLLLSGVGILFIRIHLAVASWQTSAMRPVRHSVHLNKGHTLSNGSQITNPLNQGFQAPNLLPNLNAMNPLAHQNSWLIAAVITVSIVSALLFLANRLMSQKMRANLLQRFQSASVATSAKHTNQDGAFMLSDIEIGVRKDNGRRVLIEGRDRVLHTLVVGSTGTGKTSRILTKGVFQDIRQIAMGNPMDVIVLDPDGGFAQSALDFAEKLHVKRDVIDLRGGVGHVSTVSFNPFSGGDIADIVDNVRVVLKEQMGEQDSFFQNAQDDLVRTVIQVQVPLWPDTDFVQFAELVTDPVHFRAVCAMVYDHAMQRNAQRGKGKKDDSTGMADLWAHERPYIEARFDEMEEHHRSIVLSAARSFLMDTRTEAKLEHLEKITKGLKIVVNELATNERMRQVLRRGQLPMFDFESFFQAGKEEPGRLIVVITGNRTFGKLFGKLFLITMKTYALNRSGSEWTRRPVYLYADEFAVFGTDSFIEAFSQIRKYRVAMMLAIQARSQLQDVSKKFLEVVEGNCRNKIVFPAPSSNDAKFFEDALGTVVSVKETHMENKLNWFGFDNRNRDRRISTREDIDPRFRIEDLSFGLSKDEAVFLMTVDNQAQVPFVGYTSVAAEWIKQNRGFLAIPLETSETDAISSEARWMRRMKKEDRLTRKEHKSAANSFPQSVTRVLPDKLDGAAEVQGAFVDPLANPREVIPVQATSELDRLRTDEEGRPAESMLGALEKEIATSKKDASSLQFIRDEADQNQTTSTVKRLDLRRKVAFDKSGSREGKACPECQKAYLELTSDERKWRCPKCGFDRKNRKY